MNFKNYKPVLNLLLLTVVAYALHKTIFYSFNIYDAAFHYSLETLYLIFSVLSIIVLVVLLKVKERSFDNVGMSFLLSTSVKMVVCYLILRPVLQASSQNNGIEKKNFFAMFILFLAMETILTIRILNKNQ
ncbi:FlaA1/EpsC-like NDP-sugar epimerase [Flavobacterium sp. CG_23.5]|uniref:hypothetical protein n=1 Tax=unclassified Flavobacterium TaxID=196869 RepID=UPI0018C9C783|nr:MULTISPECIES: hypothetical protein [unclassified Flavobacterium]MBG6111739.1 FlaA1/EpsC-like NDP-sugar epimerase [Flavobacterium sp. CG_9.10]MBP2283660.1 FlaA1/EpsC-like NDP-sugar epimerase [Flavobacterium sp. CG_23.5]